MSNDYLPLRERPIEYASVFNLEQAVHEITDPYDTEVSNELYKRLIDS